MSRRVRCPFCGTISTEGSAWCCDALRQEFNIISIAEPDKPGPVFYQKFKYVDDGKDTAK